TRLLNEKISNIPADRLETAVKLPRAKFLNIIPKTRTLGDVIEKYNQHQKALYEAIEAKLASGDEKMEQVVPLLLDEKAPEMDSNSSI
ncbi:MAG: hypothetical protein AAFS10_22380, partial [Myxococcota bacterium]